MNPLLPPIISKDVIYNAHLNALLIKRANKISDCFALFNTEHGERDLPDIHPLQEVVAEINDYQENLTHENYCRELLVAGCDKGFNQLNKKLERIFLNFPNHVDVASRLPDLFIKEHDYEASELDLKAFSPLKIAAAILGSTCSDFLSKKMQAAVSHRLLIWKSKQKEDPPNEIPLYQINSLQYLGCGGFAKVYKGKYKDNNVAVKLLQIDNPSSKATDEFKKESDVASKLKSRYIVGVIGVYTQSACLSIILEYMSGGNLQELLSRSIDLSWNKKLLMAKEIASGLKHLHDNRVLHCDLKSTNVLLDKQYHCKLADFGLCIVKDESSKLSQTSDDGFGTISYMAPELLQCKPRHSYQSDIYAFSIVLWELLTREKPFPAQRPTIIRTLTAQGERQEIPSDASRPYSELVIGCWQQLPQDRWSLVDILKSLDAQIQAENINPPEAESPINNKLIAPRIVRFLCLKDIISLVSCSHSFRRTYTNHELWDFFCKLRNIKFDAMPISNYYIQSHVCSPELRVAAHWRFNYWEGGNIRSVLDHSGNGLHLYLTTAEYMDSGDGVHFGRRYAEAPISGKLDASVKFTVEALVKPSIVGETHDSYNYPIISKSSCAAGWELRFSARPEMVVTPGAHHLVTGVDIHKLEDKWYHIAGTYDGTILQLYINHVQRSMNSNEVQQSVNSNEVQQSVNSNEKTFSLVPSTERLMIGSNPYWRERCLFEGVIGEVRICHSVLTPDQFLRMPVTSKVINK